MCFWVCVFFVYVYVLGNRYIWRLKERVFVLGEVNLRGGKRYCIRVFEEDWFVCIMCVCVFEEDRSWLCGVMCVFVDGCGFVCFCLLYVLICRFLVLMVGNEFSYWELGDACVCVCWCIGEGYIVVVTWLLFVVLWKFERVVLFLSIEVLVLESF